MQANHLEQTLAIQRLYNPAQRYLETAIQAGLDSRFPRSISQLTKVSLLQLFINRSVDRFEAVGEMGALQPLNRVYSALFCARMTS